MAAFPSAAMIRVDIVGTGFMRVQAPGGVQELLLYVLSVQNHTAAWTVSQDWFRLARVNKDSPGPPAN